MEKMGVPSVPIITEAYLDLARSVAAERGMPTLRTVFTPHPIWGKTPAQLRVIVDGPDPVTGKPMMKEISDALTTPLSPEDQKSGLQTVSLGPPVFGPNTSEDLQKYFMNNGMTDYLPINIPTEEKVAAMLKGTRHHPDEEVGKTGGGANGAWHYTVKQVAVNAVMAGCEPEYFPVILAIASSGRLALGGSTTSFCSTMIVNGPIRDKLNMNYGIGALGPFAQPNATIGRAWTLMGKNLGPGAIPGQTYWGSQGNNLDYNNVVIAEDEKSSPWTPFHVQKGSGALNPKFDEQIGSMFRTMARMFNCLAILDPLTAKLLVDQGYDTKEKLQDWLWKNTTVTAKEYRESFLAYVWLYPRALAGEQPYATWWKASDDTPIPCWPKADDIAFVVAGGQTNAMFQIGNMNYSGSVSIDKWM
jgi:hypothetical protein